VAKPRMDLPALVGKLLEGQDGDVLHHRRAELRCPSRSAGCNVTRLMDSAAGLPGPFTRPFAGRCSPNSSHARRTRPSRRPSHRSGKAMAKS
jgi:hypothetical protein